MRWLTLYLRSRRVPVAAGSIAGVAVLMWTLWSLSSNSRDAGFPLVVLTVLLMVTAATATLAGPDDALERTAALRWPSRRAVHLLAVPALVTGLLLLTLVTGARFAPAAVVVRDAAGMLGLTALGAASLGVARAWWLPLGWTLVSIIYPQTGTWGQAATWPAQPPDSKPAAVAAALFGLGGLVAYALAGPVPRAPAEAGT